MSSPASLLFAVDQSGGRLAGARVLVVEDDDDSRALLILLLENAQMEVLSAATEREAFEVFAHGRVDIILSDLDLPDGNGCNFIRGVRELHPDATALPAIAMTAHLPPEVRRRALSAGFQACLAKPLELDALLALLEKLRPVSIAAWASI